MHMSSEKEVKEVVKEVFESLNSTIDTKAAVERWKAVQQAALDNQRTPWDSTEIVLMEWLSLPPAARQPKTLEGLAEILGCSPESLSRIKRKPAFNNALWELQQNLVQQSWIMDIIMVFVAKAKLGDLQAARFVLEAAGRIGPLAVQMAQFNFQQNNQLPPPDPDGDSLFNMRFGSQPVVAEAEAELFDNHRRLLRGRED
jgi:hypothetical protein